SLCARRASCGLMSWRSSARPRRPGRAQTPAAHEAALALYEGDLLPADPYADWAAARREQLRRTRQELLAQTARLYAARGALRQSIERWQELLAGDAADEAAHRELM